MRPTGNAELDGFRAWLSCPELPETTRARRDTKKKGKAGTLIYTVCGTTVNIASFTFDGILYAVDSGAMLDA